MFHFPLFDKKFELAIFKKVIFPLLNDIAFVLFYVIDYVPGDERLLDHQQCLMQFHQQMVLYYQKKNGKSDIFVQLPELIQEPISKILLL